ncbi:MAG: recombinase family protein [Alphaproteobacteria bacterium]|nr:MAG: recombinase family protein [Alphaproteobacteria bacterium]
MGLWKNYVTELMKIGYIRSEKKGDAFYETQAKVLGDCERIFEDIGSQIDELEHMFDYIRPDDRICIYQLDRFGLNVRDVITLIHELLEKGIHLFSVHDGVDTSTHEGRVLLKIFNTLNLCEQNSVVSNSRTANMGGRNAVSSIVLGQLTSISTPKSNNISSIASATSSGSLSSSAKELFRSSGRPKGLTPQAKEKAEIAASMYQEGSKSMRDIAQELNISTATLYSYLRHEKVI